MRNALSANAMFDSLRTRARRPFAALTNFVGAGFSVSSSSVPRDLKQATSLRANSQRQTPLVRLIVSGTVLLSAAPCSFAQITFAPAVSYPLVSNAQSHLWGCQATGDFNGDGRPDVAVCGVGGIWVFMNKGDGTFLSPFPVGSTPDVLAVADLDKDSHPDLISTSGKAVQVSLNRGFGSFSAPATYLLPSGWSVANGSILVGDFNGDGQQDVAVSDKDHGVVIYFGQGDGTLAEATHFVRRIAPGNTFPTWAMLTETGLMTSS
jgi:FG-GAP-like repeat